VLLATGTARRGDATATRLLLALTGIVLAAHALKRSVQTAKTDMKGSQNRRSLAESNRLLLSEVRPSVPVLAGREVLIVEVLTLTDPSQGATCS